MNRPWNTVPRVNKSGARSIIGTAQGYYYSDDDFATGTKGTVIAAGIGEEADSLNILNGLVYDIEFSNNQKVFIATGRGVFVSTDNGTTISDLINWEDLQLSLPNPSLDNATRGQNISRYEVAVSPSNPNYVYIMEIGLDGRLVGIWQSSDNGTTWANVVPPSTLFADSPAFTPCTVTATAGGTTPTSICRYAAAMAVFPTNPESIMFSGYDTYFYTPTEGVTRRGTTTTLFGLPVQPNYVPPAVFEIVFDPSDSNAVYLSSDFQIVRGDASIPAFQVAVGGLNAAQVYNFDVGPDGRILSSNANGLMYTLGATNNAFVRAPGSASGATEIFAPKTIALSRYLTGNGYFFAPGAYGRSTTSYSESSNIVAFDPRLDLDSCLVDKLGTEYPSLAGASIDDREYLGAYDAGSGLPGYSNGLSFGPFTTPILLEEFATRADGLIQDTLGNQFLEQYGYFGTRNGVYLITTPFATSTNPDSTNIPNWTLISPRFGEELSIQLNGMPSAIAVSPDSLHTLIVGTSQGFVYRITRADNPCHPDYAFEDITPSEDFYVANGKENQFESTLPGDDYTSGYYITDIEFDPNNANRIIITQGGFDEEAINFNTGQFGTKVTYTENVLDDASNIEYYNLYQNGGALPWGPVYTAYFNPRPDRDPSDWYIMLGTQYGVFTANQVTLATDGISQQFWQEANGGDMKRVPVMDIKAQRNTIDQVFYPNSERTGLRSRQLNEARILIGTLGRGIFEENYPVGLREDNNSLGERFGDRLDLYPNPTTSRVQAAVELPTGGEVTLTVMDLTGRIVASQAFTNLGAGPQQLSVSLEDATAGVYLVRALVNTSQGSYLQTGRLVVQR